MSNIKTVLFDLGGVIINLDPQQAVDRFKALGLQDAQERLNSYTQSGIFGDFECGKLTTEEFRCELGKLVGHEVTTDECNYAWQGYAKEVPLRNLEALERLRRAGFRVVLLSNTNPCMMEWVGSDQFDGRGHAVYHYFDACYLSYQMKLMKPSEAIFREVLRREKTFASEVLFVDDGPRNVMVASQLGMQTLCPENGEDWTEKLFLLLGIS
ncbi:MAG: HAD family phosphatase [Prevotella sp.]|nr:HAD family phosphatase [Prevotella sp.]